MSDNAWTTCPKCGYERKPDDFAPAWQCPQCGIVYEKYDGSGTLLADSRSDRPSSFGKKEPVKSRESSTALTGWLLFIVAAIVISAGLYGYFRGAEPNDISSMSDNGAANDEADETASNDNGSMSDNSAANDETDETASNDNGSMSDNGEANDEADETASKDNGSMSDNGEANDEADETASNDNGSMPDNGAANYKADQTASKDKSRMSDNGAANYKADQTASKKVVLYTARGCRYCDLAKDFLIKNDVAFIEYNINESEENSKKFNDLNGRGVPLIFVGKNRISGWNQKALESSLKDAGLI